MSELRSVVEYLRAESLPELPDVLVEEGFAELQGALEALEVERLRRLAEIERRGSFARDGHLSVASWLSSRFQVAWGTARGDARLARALEAMPETTRALEAGEVSLSAARVLVGAREADPEAFSQAEASLVEAARIHAIGDLRRVAAYWRQRVERERSLRGVDTLWAGRRLHASVTVGGMVRLDGDLDPETGETFMTALRAVLDAGARSGGDDRTPAQRRADALGEICRGWLDAADRPQVAAERPHVTVTVDAGVLGGDRGEGGAGVVTASTAAPAEFDHVGPVAPEVAWRLACDASIMRVVMAGESQPLDVGRRTPVVSPSIRRAVILRDRHCRFPGCERPHAWCDAHHVVHWARGGPTSLANLLLLCRRHHRMVHARGGFELELSDVGPVFLRSDGSVLHEPDDRAPP